jgi:hypothetical protein
VTTPLAPQTTLAIAAIATEMDMGPLLAVTLGVRMILRYISVRAYEDRLK